MEVGIATIIATAVAVSATTIATSPITRSTRGPNVMS